MESWIHGITWAEEGAFPFSMLLSIDPWLTIMIVYNNTTAMEVSVYNILHNSSSRSPTASIIRIMLGFGMDYVMVSNPHIDYWEDYPLVVAKLRVASIQGLV